MYTYGIFNQKRGYKTFCWWEVDLKRGLSIEKWKFMSSKHRHLGCLSKSDGLECCAVHSDFNLGERIWKSGPKRANLKVHIQICPFGATSLEPATYIQIWVHSTKIPDHCLWLGTPHANVWATCNFNFLMGGPRFEINFPPAKIS